MRPGTYGGFTLDGKGVVLFAMPGPRPLVTGPVVIRGHSPDTHTVIRNVDFAWIPSGSLLTKKTFVEIADVEGSVWFEDCVLSGADPGLDMLSVTRCASLALIEGDPHPTVAIREGRKALVALSSEVSLYESLIFGPVGGYDTTILANQAGGTAATLLGCSVFASGSTFEGTEPGQVAGLCNSSSGLPFCLLAEPGGNGIVNDASMITTVGCTFTAGPARPGDNLTCPAGSQVCPPGQSGVAIIGEVDQLSSPVKSYRITGPVVAGQSYRLIAVGNAGDSVFSMFSDRPESLDVPQYFGRQLVALPIMSIWDGVTGFSGVYTENIPVPPIAAYLPFEMCYVQGLVMSNIAETFLSSPSTLIVTAH